MLFAKDVLSRQPGAEIIYDVKSTRNLAPWIREHGGVPSLWKTGHSLIKARMRERGAALAGEMSGTRSSSNVGTGSMMRNTPGAAAGDPEQDARRHGDAECTSRFDEYA